jgi:NAD(P)-dependent dehydrogenase (short-subunit alcohol dehydrogenase family)
VPITRTVGLSTALLSDQFYASFPLSFLLSSIGGFNFFQSYIRALQSDPNWQKPQDPNEALGNILITGATASVRGSAKFGTFAASKFALKALAESLAREYGSQGIHVSHFVIDGLIITERTTAMLGDKWEPHARMEPDDIAQVYLDVSRQKRNTWAFNLDLRPGPEKF